MQQNPRVSKRRNARVFKLSFCPRRRSALLFPYGIGRTVDEEGAFLPPRNLQGFRLAAAAGVQDGRRLLLQKRQTALPLHFRGRRGGKAAFFC